MSLTQFARVSEAISKDHQQIDVARVFIDEEIINQVPLSVINQIYLEIFTAIKGNGKFIERFEIDGVMYIFEPDLKNAPCGMISDIKTLEEIGVFENLHKILAILYREGKRTFWGKYKIEPYTYFESRSELFLKKCTADIAASALVFFSSLAGRLK